MNTSESVVVVAIILSVTVLVLAKRKPDNTVNHGRQALKVSFQIVCLDCSTDSDIPRRTELAIDGKTCLQCGGTAWVPAANLRPRTRERYAPVVPDVSYQPRSIVDIRERNRKARGL